MYTSPAVQHHMICPLGGDTLLFIDFRADRMRQIVEAFGIKPQFTTDVSLNDLVSILGNLNVFHNSGSLGSGYNDRIQKGISI